MGIFSFVKSAGEKLFGRNPAQKAADTLAEHIRKFNLGNDSVKVEQDGSTVRVSGEVATQEEKEKILLALGNVEGVEEVDESITVTTPPVVWTVPSKGEVAPLP